MREEDGGGEAALDGVLFASSPRQRCLEVLRLANADAIGLALDGLFRDFAAQELRAEHPLPLGAEEELEALERGVENLYLHLTAEVLTRQG